MDGDIEIQQFVLKNFLFHTCKKYCIRLQHNYFFYIRSTKTPDNIFLLESLRVVAFLSNTDNIIFSSELTDYLRKLRR